MEVDIQKVEPRFPDGGVSIGCERKRDQLRWTPRLLAQGIGRL